MSREDVRHGIEELAELGGVTRRTVRYYIQEGLLPQPFGVGRGPHYGKPHLDALLEVKALQEAGRTLDEIRDLLSRPGRTPWFRAAPATGAWLRAAPAPATGGAFPRSVWRRFVLAPGVELHVTGDVQAPTAAGLEQLAEWCRVHLAPRRTPGEEP